MLPVLQSVSKEYIQIRQGQQQQIQVCFDSNWFANQSQVADYNFFSKYDSDPEQTEHSDNDVHANEHEDIENIIELEGIEKEIRSNENANGPTNRPAFNF